MGCANSKTGATAGEEAAPPKVMVDGEGQDGAVAANGNAVSCANGTEGGEDGEAAKESCNGDSSAKNEESGDAQPSGGESAEQQQNGGEQQEEEAEPAQDGGDNNEEQPAAEPTEEEKAE